MMNVEDSMIPTCIPRHQQVYNKSTKKTFQRMGRPNDQLYNQDYDIGGVRTDTVAELTKPYENQ